MHADGITTTVMVKRISWLTLNLEGVKVKVKAWRRGVVASVVRRMNEVTVRRARLVLGWVTVFGRVYRHDT